MWPLASIGPLWGPFLPLGVEREGAAEPHVPRDAGEAGLMLRAERFLSWGYVQGLI